MQFKMCEGLRELRVKKTKLIQKESKTFFLTFCSMHSKHELPYTFVWVKVGGKRGWLMN